MKTGKEAHPHGREPLSVMSRSIALRIIRDRYPLALLVLGAPHDLTCAVRSDSLQTPFGQKCLVVAD